MRKIRRSSDFPRLFDSCRLSAFLLRYLKYGGKVVFFGRFVAVLRALPPA
jgi:membrane protein DedA with SNARE-associated domain